MYALLTYPMQVVTTNRILQTSFAKEGGDSLPREMATLYEKGHFQRGVFRGFLLYYLLTTCQSGLTSSNQVPNLGAGIILTGLANPFNVVLV